MAFGTNGVLGCTRLQQARLKGAMWVVAVRTLQQPFINPVVKRLRKSRLDICMALIAEVRLFHFEHGRLRFELVDAVAVGATDEGLAMRGSLEVRVLPNVAGQALFFHLLRRCL